MLGQLLGSQQVKQVCLGSEPSCRQLGTAPPPSGLFEASYADGVRALSVRPKARRPGAEPAPARRPFPEPAPARRPCLKDAALTSEKNRPWSWLSFLLRPHLATYSRGSSKVGAEPKSANPGLAHMPCPRSPNRQRPFAEIFTTTSALPCHTQ